MPPSFVETIAGQTMQLDLTRTLSGSKDIAGLCTDLFLIVIRMREAEDLGDPASLRKLISYFLDLFEKNCKSIKIPDDSIFESKYALVALIDETVLSIPGPCRDYWFSRPLQLDYFGDNIAGEEFFNKLSKLLIETDKKKDVLEIYYICLSLGFEGKYKLMMPEERFAVIDDLGRTLRRVKTRSASSLSPHGKRTDTGITLEKRRFVLPLWVSAAVSMSLVVIVYILLKISSSAQISATLKSLESFSLR